MSPEYKIGELSFDEFMSTMAGLVRIGNVDATAQQLASIYSQALLTPGQKEEAFTESAHVINSVLAEHYSNGLHWLASDFMEDGQILSVISPELIESNIAALPRSEFPLFNDTAYLPQHRSRNKAANWKGRDITQRLIFIASVLESLNDMEKMDAFYRGFQELPHDIKQSTKNKARSVTKGKPLITILRAAAQRAAAQAPRRNRIRKHQRPERASTPGD